MESTAYAFSHDNSIIKYNADVANSWFGLHYESANVNNYRAWMRSVHCRYPDGCGIMCVRPDWSGLMWRRSTTEREIRLSGHTMQK